MYENIISAFNNNRIIMITVWSDLKKSNFLYEDILYLCSEGEGKSINIRKTTRHYTYLGKCMTIPI